MSTYTTSFLELLKCTDRALPLPLPPPVGLKCLNSQKLLIFVKSFQGDKALCLYILYNFRVMSCSKTLKKMCVVKLNFRKTIEYFKVRS